MSTKRRLSHKTGCIIVIITLMAIGIFAYAMTFKAIFAADIPDWAKWLIILSLGS